MPNYGVSTQNSLDPDATSAFRKAFGGGVDRLAEEEEEKKKKMMADDEDETPKASKYLSSTNRASSYLRR